MQNGTVEVARRDTKEKTVVNMAELDTYIEKLLKDIQENIYKKALNFRIGHTTKAESYAEFKELLDGKGGFILAHWDGTSETEEKIKEETKATIRCIPIDAKEEKGKCIYSGKPSKQRVIFARAY
jgi:prolyl-tRNA synthetase